MRKAHEEKEKILSGLEDEIVNLAVKIAEKVIKKELEANPQTFSNMVKSILDIIKDAKQVTLKVNEKDYSLVENSFDELKTIIAQGELKIEIDNSLDSGDCLVISETGIIMAKIDSQLAKIRSALLEVNSVV
ncbi:MAG: hypothetical protein GXY91_05905 [Clostridia bacterium]|nr:hypothetical protein [Clostridia bacterium]